jgi:hypothetical protein
MLSLHTLLHCANWITLQGTEKEHISTPILWGFLQTSYKKDYGDIDNSGTHKTPFSMLAPDLRAQSGFNINRGRVSLRGSADKENHLNYFFMAAFENSGVTNLLNTANKTGENFLDASVTFKKFPYLYLRLGQFKIPGNEEGLRATFASPYIEFTNFTNQQLLERQIYQVGTAQTGSQAGGASTTHYSGTPFSAVSAYRDRGAQLFYTLPLTLLSDTTLTYAYMVGNGSGIKSTSSGSNETHYAYLAIEQSFNKGKGFFTESFKSYLWGYSGKRTLLSQNEEQTQLQNYAIKRYGLGFTYYKDKLRLSGELNSAQGMIYTGAKDNDSDINQQTWEIQYAVEQENRAKGGYINVQYELQAKKFELFARYDYYDRLSNDTKAQRLFHTTTLGSSYRLQGATRFDINYIIKKAQAPHNSSSQKVLDNMGNRLAFQFTAYFKNR